MATPTELLAEMRGYLRRCEHWEAWLARSGELPPDLDAMPSQAQLPDPLAAAAGRIASVAQWQSRRDHVLREFRRWIIGTYPEPPGEISARVLEDRYEANGARVREVRLSFGPGGRAALGCELAVPPGPGPFPVFMTQRNHIGWARVALSRGYAAVVYDGCDFHDDTQAFKEVWPEHDWSMLCRRAWGAGRVLDWLHTLAEIDRAHACITGHSRNGKLALICGAIDPRFDVVISSSSGVGGASPYRLANEAHLSEGIELIMANWHEWFHPRLRFFAGREDKLPIDANLLLALSAPRAVLVSSALNDPCEVASANEAAVRSARAVWGVHGAADRLGLLWRPGGHETRAEIIERYLDWCDLHCGRAESRRESLRGSFLPGPHYPYTYAGWRAAGGVTLDPARFPERPPLARAIPADAGAWAAGREDRRARIRLLLGDEPATASRPPGDYGAEQPYMTSLLAREATGTLPFTRHGFAFGEAFAAAIYAPAGAVSADLLPGFDGRIARTDCQRGPLLIWLHGECDSSGYASAYLRGPRLPAPFALAGMTVMAYDQIGGGSRLPEMARFHERHPRWSLLGKLVRDALAAVDAARGLPFVDPQRIHLCGFGIGATTALLAAALDERIAGVASVCGFTPLRGVGPEDPTGGPGRYATWDQRGYLPRLGGFAASAADARRIPIDLDEILAEIAPRPLLCVTPTRDREADHAAISVTLDAVARVYALHGAAERLWRWSPVDHRRIGPEIQQGLMPTLQRAMGM